MKRNVAILALYKDGKILFQHRADDSPRMPGYWAFFGGGVDSNESPEATIKREIKEELEYELKTPRLFRTYDFKMGDFFGTSYLFVEEYDGQELVQHEGQNMAWLTPEEFLARKTADFDRQSVRMLAKNLFGANI